MPLSLSDAEYNAVQAAAAPIHPLQRGAFLQALAAELEKHPVVGPGLVHRLRRGLAASIRCRGAQHNVAHCRAEPGEGAAETSARVIGRSLRIGTSRARPRFIARRSVLAFRHRPALGLPQRKLRLGVAGLRATPSRPP